jgi:hypothetical protein
MHIHAYIYGERIYVIMGLYEGTTGRQEEKRIIVNDTEIC